MLATIPSATLLGVDGQPVIVEVHVSPGLPGFSIVGMPDEACRESRDRVRAAVLSSGLAWPQRRITVNLAPGGRRKGGVGLDLPIAVGLLAATDALPAGALGDLAFLGELGLDGSIRPIPGVVPLVASLGERRVVLPRACAPEAELVAPGRVLVATSLAELVSVLRGDAPWTSPPTPVTAAPLPPPDLADVRGQPLARLALEVAAAGGHHLLMVGPPGSGKTMLATRLPGLLPPLSLDQALETTKIHSAAGLALPPGGLVRRPPFRAPHHSASTVSLIGGGTSSMRPGELSLAHNGCLFLDELGEFQAPVLDALRQPLEEGVVRVTRARASVAFPARVLLVAASNPCPCGDGGPPGSCGCTDAARARYLRRISGPLLDRFDLRIPVGRPALDDLLDERPGEGSAAVAARVVAARERAEARGHGLNNAVPSSELDTVMPLSSAARLLLHEALRAGRLTGRGLHRVRRVARTLADLAGAGDVVGDDHLALALGLRTNPFATDAAGAATDQAVEG